MIINAQHTKKKRLLVISKKGHEVMNDELEDIN